MRGKKLKFWLGTVKKSVKCRTDSLTFFSHCSTKGTGWSPGNSTWQLNTTLSPRMAVICIASCWPVSIHQRISHVAYNVPSSSTSHSTHSFHAIEMSNAGTAPGKWPVTTRIIQEKTQHIEKKRKKSKKNIENVLKVMKCHDAQHEKKTVKRK